MGNLLCLCVCAHASGFRMCMRVCIRVRVLVRILVHI